MNAPATTLEDVLAAAASRSASLAPETSGYLMLGVAEAAQRVPLLLDPRSVLITPDGDVDLRPSGEVVSAAEAGRQLRDLLGQLLSVSAGALSGLSTAANPARGGDIDALVVDIEAALIPMNRAAGRRAIARLARDTLRSGSRGAPRRPAPPPRPPAPVEPPAPPSTDALAPAEPPAHRATPPAPPVAAIPRPASPGERKLEALRLARTGLRGVAPWVGWTGDARFSERTPEATSPTAETCSTSAPTVPLRTSVEALDPGIDLELVEADSAALDDADSAALDDANSAALDDADSAALDDVAAPEPAESLPLWIEAAGDAPIDRRGLTMRWSFVKDGSTGLLEGGAPVAGRAEILAFFEQTPSAPIELVGSPTIAMEVGPFEPPTAGETLPWPASYPYERVSARPTVLEAPLALPSLEPHAAEHPQPEAHERSSSDAMASLMSMTASDPGSPLEIPEVPEISAEPASVTPSSASLPAPLEPAVPAPTGPDRADELLRRFALGPDGETANIRAAAKNLRAIAGVDVTPTAASILPSAVAAPEPAPSPDDITPPATSPGPASVRAPRPARRGLVRSALAFAAGLAGATAVMHVEPAFPERVAELIDHAIPAADPPSPPGPASPPAEPPASPGAPAEPSTP